MYHSLFRDQGRVALAALTGVAMLFAAGSAQADELKCRRAIAKNTAKFESKKLKTLQKCEDGRLKGTVTGTCPDTKASEKITGAATKLNDAIIKDCDATAVAAIFPGATCPAFENDDFNCAGPVTTGAELATCLECISEGSVDQMIAFYFGGLFPAGDDGDLVKCERALGKNATKFFATKRKVLQKCEDGHIKASTVGVCPDAEGATKISDAATKLAEKVEKACETFDQDDYRGIAYCPALGGCGNVINTRAETIDCLECLTAFKADCTNRISAPGNGAVPASCNPTCGNGVTNLDLGETCDDGNYVDGDACPRDCSVSTSCPSPGGPVVGTVNLAGVPTAGLSSVIMFITYPDGTVQIGGSGGGAIGINAVGADSVSPNDLNYGLRVLTLSPDGTTPINNPPFTIDFITCNGAVPTDGMFKCVVESAFDTAAQPVNNLTCAVDVP